MFAKEGNTKRNRDSLHDSLCIGDKESLKMFTEEIQNYFNIVEEGILEKCVGCEPRKLNKEELIMN